MLCKYCNHWLIDPSQTRLPERGLCCLTSSVYSERDDRLTMANEMSAAISIGTPISEFTTKYVTSRLETLASFGCNQFEKKAKS